MSLPGALPASLSLSDCIVGRLKKIMLSSLLHLATPTEAVAQLDYGASFADEVVFSGLVQPFWFAFASDGRVVVDEKSGRILVFATPSRFVYLLSKRSGPRALRCSHAPLGGGGFEKR